MKKTGKCLSLLLALCLLLSLLPTAALAAWSGAGDGTSENPYQIGTAAELKAFRDLVNGGEYGACAVLTADIDLNNEAWTPIGGPYSSAYTGTFDGKGYTISGLNVSINTSGHVYAGLFGFVGFNQSGTVRNVHVGGSVSAESTDTGASVGGVVGSLLMGTVQNCAFTGAVSAIGKSANTVRVGGVVGDNQDTVDGCLHVGGDVSATSDSTHAYAGGIAGVNGYGSVQHSAHTGGKVTATATGGKDAYAGGVVGLCLNYANTEYCFSTGGAVTASSTGAAAAGGVAGVNWATLTNCYYDSTKATGLTAVSGAADSETVMGLTTAQFKNQANFHGWEFDTVWYMGANSPELWALASHVSTWTALGAALNAGGGIVLDADVTPDNPYLADALTVPLDVTAALDLNGHTVDRGYTEQGFDGSVIKIYGTLTVTDSASGGAITGGFPDQYGGGVQILGGTFNLLGGAITGNSVGKTGFFGTEGLGGGVYMQSGTFHMSGGSITGNKALGSNMGSSLGRGGGVYITDGTFHFNGGEISGNEAGILGGGVYVASTYSAHDGKINVSGGAAVTDNTVSGAESNVYLEEGGVLTVTDALTNTTPIGVTMQTPGVFTSGLSGKGTAANFKSDDASFGVALSGAEAALFPNPVVTFVSNGGTGTMADQTVGYGAATALTANAYARAGYTFTDWNTESGGGGTPYADGADVTLTAGLTLYAQWRKNELAVADIAAQTYTGNALTPALTVTDKYTVGPLIAGTHYTANWENNTNAGNDTARVTVTGMGDYCLADPVVKQFTINRAEWANKTASASVRRGNSGAVNLSAQLAPGGTLGAPTVTAGDVVYSVGMDANVLRVSIRNDAAPGDTATVSVPVTGAANYEDYAVTVTITATDKETQTLSFADAAVTKTYGDADFTLAASHPVGDGAVSYAVTAGDAVEVNSTTGAVHILKAGTATVTATAAETLQYAEASASYTLTVKPKPVTVTADDKAKTVGDPDPALTATVAGLVNGDAAGVLTYGIECVHEETAGTYPIAVSGDTAQGNYSVTFVSGTLTISAAPTAKTQEPTPNATFTATGPDSGTLTGVAAGMIYAIDGGAAVEITGTSVDLTGLVPCTITIVQPGNGATTIDSETQTITVTKAETPSLTPTQPSTMGGTGSIPTTAEHEFSEEGTTWTACTGETTGLASGTYFVRVKASGTVLASEAQSITITAFEKVPQPGIPSGITVSEIGAGSVWLTGVAGEEYVIALRGALPDWTAAITADEYNCADFNGLEEATEYTVFARIAETDYYLPGAAVTRDVTTHISTYGFSGEPLVGGTVSAPIDEVYDQTGVSYQWYLDGTAIIGATGASYVVQEGDAGKVLSVMPLKNGAPLWDGAYEVGEAHYAIVNFYMEYKDDPDELELVQSVGGLKFGDTLQAPARPVRNGYRFAGWQEGVSGAFEDIGFPMTVAYSTDLYAKWTEYVYYPDPTPTVETVTVPVSGDDMSINVTVEIRGSTAIITKANIDAVLEAEHVGTVVIDLSSLKTTVTEVVIPGELLTKIADAVADEDCDAEGLEIRLPGGSVAFNADALETITQQANNHDLTLHIGIIGIIELNEAQQTALANMEVIAVCDISLSFGREQISDFKGGTATVAVPCELREGQSPRGIVVWHVAADGNLTEIPSIYNEKNVVFRVGHFSNYVIAYDAERAAACPKDDTCPMSAFSDLDPTLWYHDGIHFCLENGMMNGIGNGKFDPSDTTNRAMIVTILYRLEGEPEVSAENPFDDVAAGQWYTDAVIWAAENKIVEGYGNGKFGPNDPITREQLATILYRYAQSKGQGFQGTWMFLLDYPDASEISSWADEAMHWMVMNEIIKGKDGKLVPGGDASRAEAATMLMRYCTKLAE